MARRRILDQLSVELADLVAAAMPSVVSLIGVGQTSDISGSGFLIDDEGHVVTNWHVIDALPDGITASTPGGPRQPATVVGSDVLTDLAVVRLAEAPGDHLTLRGRPARLGELCVALGSPLGIYPESVSFGMVSGVARTIPQPGTRPIERAIQTDAAINPGNSGGPLIDVHGEVLGVNKCVDNRGAGLGFAIPADTVETISAALIADGAVTRASLGVTVANRAVELDGHEVMRLVVTRVRRPTDGGFAVGDVILSIEGEVCDERDDLYNHLTKDRIGKELGFEVLRDGKVAQLSMVPAKLDA